MSTDTLCRLCGLLCDAFVNIYEEDGVNRALCSKIASCLQIWISPKDILPTTVCLTCCTKLDEFFAFYEVTSKAQLLLNKIYDPSKAFKKERTEVQNVLPDHFQCEEREENENEDLEIQEGAEEKEVEASAPTNMCKESDPAMEKHSITVRINVKPSLSTKSDSDYSEEDDFDTILPVQRKSNRRKKDPHLNDVPLNPRLTAMLQGYPWPCTICQDIVMNSLQELREHYKSKHGQPPVFKCISCEKLYDRYRSFARHIKLHRSPKKYTCDVCGKSFAQRTVLQSHATVHSSDRPHACPTCGKSFKNFSSLYVHGKMHLPDQVKEKFPCQFCQKEFSTRHTLETHRKIHTGERNFVCDICGKSFIAKGSLDYHLLSHTGDKNHVCTTCNKAFKTARLLNKHISLHTGIKPHQCDVCGKQFRERGALREHSRIHTGVMPYSCEFCGKCFRFKGILTVHRRQHTGERPYACIECRRYFTNWANYNKHMKRIHHYDTSNPENSRLRAGVRAAAESAAANSNQMKTVVTNGSIGPDFGSHNTESEIYVSSPQTSITVQHS